MKNIKHFLSIGALSLSLAAFMVGIIVPLAPVHASTSTSVSSTAKKTTKSKKKVLKKKRVTVKKYTVNPWKSVKFNIPESFTATVTAVDDRAHQVSGKSDQGLMIIQITPDTVLKVNGIAGNFSDIAVGDSITVKGDGQVTQSSIVTAKTLDDARTSVPVAPAAVAPTPAQ